MPKSSLPVPPFSQACENNKQPILEIIKTLFVKPITIVEIGSGTGQHGVYFSQQLTHINWQPTDLEPNLAGIEQWRSSVANDNLKPCLILDVKMQNWPVKNVDAFFSANTAHIMSWEDVQLFIAGVGLHLRDKGTFCLYGPFSYKGAFTSQSNADFDRHLKEMNPKQGIRDFEAVVALAEKAGLSLQADHEMPANNRLLVFSRTT